MTSRASSYKRGVIRRNLGRFWLLSVWVGAVLLSRTTGSLPILPEGFGLTHEDLYNTWTDIMIPLARGFWPFLMSFVIAACVFSYLHNKRANCFFHSLPLRRNDLFLGSFLSGLAIYSLPMLLHVVLTLPQLLITHSHCTDFLTAYLRAMAYHMLLFFLCYSIATFAMVLSGRVFFGVIAALLLHVIFPVTESLLRSILNPWLFGLGFSAMEDPYTICLAPLIYLRNQLSDSAFDLPWAAMGIYSGAALLLNGLSLWLHRRRQEEQVGQSFVFPTVLSVLRYLLSLLLGYVFCCLCLLITGGDPETAGGYGVLICSVPAFFLIQMLLHRTPKVWGKKNFLACGIYALALTALLLTFQLDLTGLVGRVPEAERVKEITITFDDMTYTTTDPQAIEDIIAIHREILCKKEVLQEETYNGAYSFFDLGLTYTMERGGTLRRSYPLYSPIYNKPASMAVHTDLLQFFREGDRAVDQLRQLFDTTGNAELRMGKKDWFMLSTLQKQQLFAALEQDMKNGMEPMIILHTQTNTTGYDLRLQRTDTRFYHYIDLPYSATATRAFLEELGAKSD